MPKFDISACYMTQGRLYDLSKADALATLTCASVPDQDKLEGWYTFGRCLPWQSLQENALLNSRLQAQRYLITIGSWFYLSDRSPSSGSAYHVCLYATDETFSSFKNAIMSDFVWFVAICVPSGALAVSAELITRRCYVMDIKISEGLWPLAASCFPSYFLYRLPQS